jgi:hypothetical protein
MLILTPPLAPPVLVTDGLVGAWRLSDQSSGTLITDWSGNGNQGTTYNGPIWVADGLSFQGSQGIMLPDNPSLQLVGAVTLATWVKTAITGLGMLVHCYDMNAPYYGYGGLIGYPASGNYSSWSNEWLPGTSIVNDDTWHHVAMSTTSGGAMAFYKDGVADGTAQAAASINFFSGPRNIAIQPGGTSGLVGTLADVRIYNRALSAAEIARIYAGTG